MEAKDPYALCTTVRLEEEGIMVKELITKRFDLSRGLLRRMKRGGGVYLNGKRDYLTRRVRAGDQLKIVLYDEETQMRPEDIPLNIIYEDDYLLVVNKPAGMAVHPSGAYQEGTLANAVAYHWQSIGLKSKVRLAHRIDKDTSGLVMIAKEPYTLEKILQQLSGGEFSREYLAVVAGRPRPGKAVITAPIGRSMDHGVKRAVSPGGKDASTHYEILSTGGKASLLRIRLESGRTHQIRVHLAAVGHPLLGDPLYGEELPSLQGQALHAWSLEFRHPRLGGRRRLSCPLPPALLRLWKKQRKGK